MSWPGTRTATTTIYTIPVALIAQQERNLQTMGAIEEIRGRDIDTTLQYAIKLDAEDPLRELREEFIIPSKSDLRSTTIPPHRAFLNPKPTLS